MNNPIPGMPDNINPMHHDGGDISLVPAETLASFAVGTFLENITLSTNGTIFMTSFHDGTIIRKIPGHTQEEFAHIAGTVSGIVTTTAGKLCVCNQQPQGPERICVLDAHGKIETCITLPAARFLNGMTSLSDQLLLAADSFTATIWQVDLTQQRVSRWLTHELLSKSSPESSIPGPNGIKVFDGAVFVSNSERSTVIRVPIGPEQQAGQPILYADHLLLDDFTFDDQGNLYGTTHPLNTVIRLASNGTRLTIGGPEQGVGGCTAAAFGTVEGTRHLLYVVTDGGALANKPEPARLVCLDTSQLEKTKV